MEITKEFLEAEIRDLEQEMQKANVFLIKAQGTVEAYKMLIQKLDTAEPSHDAN